MRYLFSLIFSIVVYAVSAEEYIYKFNIDDFSTYDFVAEDGETYTRFKFPGYDKLFPDENEFYTTKTRVGVPELPLISADEVDISSYSNDYQIFVKIISKRSFQLSHKIYPVQYLETTSNPSTHTFVPCLAKVYNSDNSYPRACASDIGCLELCPILYYPKEDRYEFISEMKVIVTVNNVKRDEIMARTEPCLILE